jgi:hypothetical protein
VELNSEEDTGRYAIIAIEPAPLDEVAPDPELVETVASGE